ncbi:hypothetical protein NO108_00779 [Planktothrix rubescens]|nr:hypothetical protein NO108_00779 [Planktothrix rubescens]CAH2573028.1 hypothetical protein PRNO82_02437 [Planktothrix rubescens]
MLNQLTKEKNNNQPKSWVVGRNLPVEGNSCPADALAPSLRKHRYRFTVKEIEDFTLSGDSRQTSSIDVIDIQEPVKRHRYRFTLSEIEAFAPELNI